MSVVDGDTFNLSDDEDGDESADDDVFLLPSSILYPTGMDICDFALRRMMRRLAVHLFVDQGFWEFEMSKSWGFCILICNLSTSLNS